MRQKAECKYGLLSALGIAFEDCEESGGWYARNLKPILLPSEDVFYVDAIEQI